MRDRGPGIPADDQAHVFDRFYRSATARTEPGSGLGLAIVKQAVERHGGTVWAANRTDRRRHHLGAAVGFDLPTPVALVLALLTTACAVQRRQIGRGRGRGSAGGAAAG